MKRRCCLKTSLIFAVAAVASIACNKPNVSPPFPIHFRVNALEGTTTNGRLALFWTRLTSTGPVPSAKPFVDVPFSTASSVDFPFPMSGWADVPSEPPFNNPPLTVGVIGVFEDSNGNGSADGMDRSYGAAFMAVVYSLVDKPAGSFGEYNEFFPQGVKAGTNLYTVQAGTPQQLVPVPWDTVFDLNVCHSPDSIGSTCNLPTLNLF